MNTQRRRHEVRDQAGRLVAVIDEVVAGDQREAALPMIELSADVGGHAYRVRIFPAEQRAVRRVA